MAEKASLGGNVTANLRGLRTSCRKVEADEWARVRAEARAEQVPRQQVLTCVGSTEQLQQQVQALPPAWCQSDEVEAPAGTKNMGSFTIAVYTAEQQARLGVNESGEPVAQPEPAGDDEGVDLDQ